MKFKIKLNSFERAAGIFMVGAFALFVLALISIAIKQAWFEDVVYYETFYQHAEGLNPSTAVLVAGIKAGSVESVEIQENNWIHVIFSVKEKYAQRIRKDSQAQVVRQFIIGEKQINISLGSASAPYQPDGGRLEGQEAVELADLLSGHRMAPYLKTLESMFGYMSSLVEQMNQSAEKFDVIAIYKEVLPTLQQARDAFSRVKSLQAEFENMSSEVRTIRKDFLFSPDMKEMVRNTKSATHEIAALTQALNQLQPHLKQSITDLAKITPEMAKASPEFARITKESVKTLNEMVIVLKAMQKSWFLKGHVEDVKEEDRAPASKQP